MRSMPNIVLRKKAGSETVPFQSMRNHLRQSSEPVNVSTKAAPKRPSLAAMIIAAAFPGKNFENCGTRGRFPHIRSYSLTTV